MNERVCAFGLVAALIAGVGCFGGDANAQSSQVLPKYNGGTSNNSIPLGGGPGGRYQVVFAEEEVQETLTDGIPAGSLITGIQLRQQRDAVAAWPTTALTIADYEVHMGVGTRPVNDLSTTFAENVTGLVRTRDGVLTLAAGAYPGEPLSPNASLRQEWGPVIAFSQAYLYRGGELVVEFRNTGAGDFAFAAATATSTNSAYGAIARLSTPTATTGLPSTVVAMRLLFRSPAAPFQAGVTRLMIPDELANQRGVGDFTLFTNSLGGAVQTIAAESQMRRLGRGSFMRGLLLRSDEAGSYSMGHATTERLEISLARATVVPEAMSDTIALNAGADEFVVWPSARSPSGSMFGVSEPPRPAPVTYEIPFEPFAKSQDWPRYAYLGGPLFSLARSHFYPEMGTAPKLDGLPLTGTETGNHVQARRASGQFSEDTLATTEQVPYPVQLWSVDSGTVVPNESATVDGTGGSFTELFHTAERTAQIILNASQLTHIPVGSQVTGLSFRSFDIVARPAASSTFTDYQVFASTAAKRPSDASTTFALNEGVDKVQVRSGVLHIQAGSFGSEGTPRPFGPTVHFDRAFIYKGGDLCFTIRHNGGDVQGWPLDAATAPSLSRYLSGVTSFSSEGTLHNISGPIVRVAYNPSIVVPTTAANTPGNAGYAILFSSSGNVVQSVYAEEDLRGLRIGSLITGMSLRRYSRSAGLANWPEEELNVGQFGVTMSTSPVPPSAMSDLFANNIGADAVEVRAAGQWNFYRLEIPAKAFPHELSQVRPNENEWFIQFTEPFVYKGGPLSLTIRNDIGQGSANGIFFADAVTGNPGAAGRWSYSMGMNAAQHSQGVNKGALAVRFVFVPKSFCPADLNNDGVVEDADFVLFLSAYNVLDCMDGAMAQGCPADLNYDRVVEDGDFEVFIGAYNELLCP